MLDLTEGLRPHVDHCGTEMCVAGTAVTLLLRLLATYIRLALTGATERLRAGGDVSHVDFGRNLCIESSSCCRGTLQTFSLRVSPVCALKT